MVTEEVHQPELPHSLPQSLKLLLLHQSSLRLTDQVFGI